MELISKDEVILIMEEELQKTAQEDESISKSARLSLLRYLVDKTTVISTIEERGADDDKKCHKPASAYYRAYCEERKEKTYCEGCRFWH